MKTINKNALVEKASRTFYKAGLKLKKHSPEILITAGVIGTVTSTVMACKATTKLNDILDSSKDDIEAIHGAMKHPEELPEEYTEEDGKKDLSIVYVQAGLKVAKLYAPSIVLGVASITSILAGHNILHMRNVAFAAAYSPIDALGSDTYMFIGLSIVINFSPFTSL